MMQLTGISLVQYVNQLLIDAIQLGASDIHIEPYETQCRIRYRQDGLLRTVAALSLEMTPYLLSRIKILANLDIAERRLPQDGRFQFSWKQDEVVDLRVSTCPTLHGEKIVVRLLSKAHTLLSVNALGMTAAQQTLFLKALSKSQGMILVCGATGSGKTMTLYTALQQLNKEEKNISTVEDPVEVPLCGINQVPVNLKAGLSFSTVLRAFLRQDPDVIMVGEVRDLETADIAVRAAQTGHLVLSTLHTNSAPEAIRRLMNLGISSLNLASSVSLVIAQSLVRKLCVHCKARAQYTPAVLMQSGFLSQEIPSLNLYRAVGCNVCVQGYQGRVGLFQVMPVSPALSVLVSQESSVMSMAAQAAQEGIWTVYESGLEKARQGITSLEEVMRVVG